MNGTTSASNGVLSKRVHPTPSAFWRQEQPGPRVYAYPRRGVLWMKAQSNLFKSSIAQAVTGTILPSQRNGSTVGQLAPFLCMVNAGSDALRVGNPLVCIGTSLLRKARRPRTSQTLTARNTTSRSDGQADHGADHPRHYWPRPCPTCRAGRRPRALPPRARRSNRCRSSSPTHCRRGRSWDRQSRIRACRRSGCCSLGRRPSPGCCATWWLRTLSGGLECVRLAAQGLQSSHTGLDAADVTV